MRARSGVESVPRCQVTTITRARGEAAMSGRDSLGYGDDGGGASEVCRVVGESVVARQQPRRVFTGRPMAQSSLGRRTARQVGELARSLATVWASAPGLATQPTHVTTFRTSP
jgi:hypothetical protein